MAAVFLALALAWAVFATGMSLAWRIERRTGNSGWVDVAWTGSLTAASLAGIAALAVLADTLQPGRVALVVIVLGAWALRLAGHLWARSARVADDPRYARLRAEWGEDAPRQMAILLQWQAVLSLPLVLSVLMAASVPVPPGVAGVAPGLLTAAAGLWIGWKADRDLTLFKRTRSGLCTTGLWAVSRHPNYLGEILFWAGVALLSIEHGEAGMGIALAGPVTIWVLLRHVSGVPPLEAHMAEKYGDAFERYRSTTPAIMPWPAKWSGTSGGQDR